LAVKAGLRADRRRSEEAIDDELGLAAHRGGERERLAAELKGDNYRRHDGQGKEAPSQGGTTERGGSGSRSG
jgi:hypothetical protein